MKIEPVRGWVMEIEVKELMGDGLVDGEPWIGFTVWADDSGQSKQLSVLVVPLIEGEDPVQVDMHYKYGDNFKMVPYPIPAAV